MRDQTHSFGLLLLLFFDFFLFLYFYIKIFAKYIFLKPLQIYIPHISWRTFFFKKNIFSYGVFYDVANNHRRVLMARAGHFAILLEGYLPVLHAKV